MSIARMQVMGNDARITKTCESCGRIFETIPSRHDQKYCDANCYRHKSSDQRFWEKVNKQGQYIVRLGSRCWEWTGGKR